VFTFDTRIKRSIRSAVALDKRLFGLLPCFNETLLQLIDIITRSYVTSHMSSGLYKAKGRHFEYLLLYVLLRHCRHVEDTLHIMSIRTGEQFCCVLLQIY